MVYNAASKTWHGTADPTAFVAMAKEWGNLGADMLGGCCQIGPKPIKGIYQYFHPPK